MPSVAFVKNLNLSSVPVFHIPYKAHCTRMPWQPVGLYFQKTKLSQNKRNGVTERIQKQQQEQSFIDSYLIPLTIIPDLEEKHTVSDSMSDIIEKRR